MGKRTGKKKDAAPKGDGVLLRAEPELLQWWADAAASAGKSRNTLLVEVLRVIRDQCELAERLEPQGEFWTPDVVVDAIGRTLIEELVFAGVGGQALVEGMRHGISSNLRNMPFQDVLEKQLAEARAKGDRKDELRYRELLAYERKRTLAAVRDLAALEHKRGGR